MWGSVTTEGRARPEGWAQSRPPVGGGSGAARAVGPGGAGDGGVGR